MIGHPYTLQELRRLPNEIAIAANDRFEVTVVGPAFYHGSPRFGDLEPAHLVVEPGETARIAGMPMFVTSNVHLAFWGDAVRRLMRERFDVVHCWDEPFNFSCTQVARLAPRDAAFSFYSFQNIDKRYPIPFNRFERYTLARADGWVAAGKLVEDVLLPRPMYAERPHRILGLGVDIARFKPDELARRDVRAKYGWDDGSDVPVICYLGRFTEAKGLPIMMRALEKIGKPWRALFIGSGDLEGNVAKWAERYPGRVAIAHNLPHAEVARYLAACDVLCAPSQTTPKWKEQFGRMLIEALACGVAIVTSDSGEIPFVVGDAGIIVPEKDEARWYDALDRVISDPTLRASLEARGLARARERFAWPVVASGHIDFFEGIVATKGLRRG